MLVVQFFYFLFEETKNYLVNWTVGHYWNHRSNFVGSTTYSSNENVVSTSVICPPLPYRNPIQHVGMTGKYYISKDKYFLRVGVGLNVKETPVLLTLSSNWKFGAHISVARLPSLFGATSRGNFGVGYCPTSGVDVSVGVEIND